jgi:hypothetical protein
MMSRIAFPMLALLVAGGCSGSDATGPVSHDAQSAVRLSENESSNPRSGALSEDESSNPRSGALHATKDCSGFTGLAGSFCTITSSSLKEIKVGTKILYLQPAELPTPSGSDVILYPPGRGHSTAFGHCTLTPGAGRGTCTFSGGTGKFKRFSASVVVTHLTGRNWSWEGTYSFDPHD